MATRLIFPPSWCFLAYFFFAGHNAPGGGFAGGLTAGLALVLRYLAGGRYELGEALPLDAGKILGAGLTLSAGTAVASLFLGAPVLSSAVFEFDVPVLGHVKLVTALFFDLGVYLIVVGLVLDVLRSLGARVDAEMMPAVRGRDRRMTTYLVPLVLIGGLTSAGVYLLLERNLTRMLLGLLLVGNAVNLLILTVAGPSGNPPIRGRTSEGETTRRPAGPGHDPDRHRHHDGHRRLRPGPDLPVLPTDHGPRRSPRPRGRPRVRARATSTRSTRTVPSTCPPRHRRPRRTRRRCPDTRVPGDGPQTRLLTPLPVLIPTLAAAATLFAGRMPRLQRAIAVLALTAVVAVCAVLVYLADRDGTIVVHVGGWGSPYPAWAHWASRWWWTGSRR